MEKEIVVTKRFRNQTLKTYEFLLRAFTTKTAYHFLEKTQERIELISRYPEIGRPSKKFQNIRSLPLIPCHLIFYRIKKSRIEILVMFDMRKNPAKRPFR
jgi:plasmid stabilization system protein ParE